MVKLLTVSEVGDYLGVSEKAVYQMIYRGKIAYVKMGPYRASRLRFKESDIEAYINECSRKAFAKAS